jgi:hypothetical protein
LVVSAATLIFHIDFSCWFISAGSTKINICAPGSTTDHYLCARQHDRSLFVRPAAQKIDICAPGIRKSG